MNNYKIYIMALGLAGMGLTSCTADFLDVESKVESTTGNFYRTESDAYRALIGCYDGWQSTVSNGTSFYMASELMADECFGGAGVSDARNYQIIDRFDQTQSPSDLNLFEGDWTGYYAAVYRCNELIAHEEQISWTSEETRGTYMGECRALRALCYFDMVRLWGNIPLFTEPVNENRPQAEPDEVYNVIFSDLLYAAEKHSGFGLSEERCGKQRRAYHPVCCQSPAGPCLFVLYRLLWQGTQCRRRDSCFCIARFGRCHFFRRICVGSAI